MAVGSGWASNLRPKRTRSPSHLSLSRGGQRDERGTRFSDRAADQTAVYDPGFRCWVAGSGAKMEAHEVAWQLPSSVLLKAQRDPFPLGSSSPNWRRLKSSAKAGADKSTCPPTHISHGEVLLRPIIPSTQSAQSTQSALNAAQCSATCRSRRLATSTDGRNPTACPVHPEHPRPPLIHGSPWRSFKNHTKAIVPTPWASARPVCCDGALRCNLCSSIPPRPTHTLAPRPSVPGMQSQT